jgi:hypothetical protein
MNSARRPKAATVSRPLPSLERAALLVLSALGANASGCNNPFTAPAGGNAGPDASDPAQGLSRLFVPAPSAAPAGPSADPFARYATNTTTTTATSATTASLTTTTTAPPTSRGSSPYGGPGGHYPRSYGGAVAMVRPAPPVPPAHSYRITR